MHCWHVLLETLPPLLLILVDLTQFSHFLCYMERRFVSPYFSGTGYRLFRRRLGDGRYCHPTDAPADRPATQLYEFRPCSWFPFALRTRLHRIQLESLFDRYARSLTHHTPRQTIAALLVMLVVKCW